MRRILHSRPKPKRPSVPNGIRVYAIGDVHGRFDLLDDIFARIDADLKADPASRVLQVLLGDYVDRGPSSRKVIDLLISRSRTHETHCLKGNHEALLLEFLHDPDTLSAWEKVGGIETLASYGLAPLLKEHPRSPAELASYFDLALPKSHRQFLAQLKTSFVCGDFFFAHAGVRPGIPLADQRETDLLWIRREFLTHEREFGKIIVHGHTPVAKAEVRSNRINIDTGAFATDCLTCLKLDNDKIAFIRSLSPVLQSQLRHQGRSDFIT
jgi:serine/threonine protein phosphatase 1